MAQPRNRETQQKTEAQLYILERFPELIRRIRKDYRQREPESSADSVSDPHHIIHWDSFLNEPIEIPIGQMGAFVKVMPIEWARAFIQPNLELITRHLCTSIFTKTNLQRHQLDELTLVVQKAAIWILEKETKHLDPWSYPYLPPDTTPIPFNEEMERIISQHTATCKCTPDNECDDNGCDLAHPDLYKMDLLTEQDLLPYMDFDFSKIGDAEFQDMMGNLIETTDTAETVENEGAHVPVEDDEPTPPLPNPRGTDRDGSQTNLKIYTGFVRYLKGKGLPINTTQIAAALTKATVTNNTDIFLDAVPISYNRWTQAAGKRQIDHIAAKLFNKIFREDFGRDPRKFSSVEDICPIKRLAIYRGAKYLQQVWQHQLRARYSDFDSAIQEHNLFPNAQERLAIDEELNKVGWDLREKRLRGVINTNINDGGNFGSFTVPEFQPSQLKHWSTVCQCNKNHAGQNLDPLSSSSGPQRTEISSILVTPQLLSDQQLPNHSGQLHMYNVQNGKTTTTNTQNDQSYTSTSTNAVAEVVLGNLTGNRGNTTIQVQPTEYITKGKHRYLKSIWEEAVRKYKWDSTEKAATYLYRVIFTAEERMNGSPSGRGTEKLPRQKMESLFDALQFMEENIPVDGREVQKWSDSRKKCPRRRVLEAVISSISYRDRGKLQAQVLTSEGQT